MKKKKSKSKVLSHLCVYEMKGRFTQFAYVRATHCMRVYTVETWLPGNFQVLPS